MFGILKTPYKNLTFPQRFLKTTLFAIGLYLAILFTIVIILVIAVVILAIKFAKSFCDGIESGINESLGRNRLQRLYWDD